VGAGIEADQADVVVEIPADDLRLGAVAVGELDEEMIGRPHARRPAGVRDHVRVRQHVALGRDDEAGAL
jgi:hypothetical protein